jgi:hypothetical protein
VILNAWQKAIARTYGGGDYAHLTEQAKVSHEELADCGDTLFEFLMIELSDQEDCEDQEEAVRRMVQARDQLDNAIAVLEAL